MLGAGSGGTAAGRSDGRVTLPLRLKSRSCDGPTSPAAGGGAAVTSTGASAFCAIAGAADISASAAMNATQILSTLRRKAVISPPCQMLAVC